MKLLIVDDRIENLQLLVDIFKVDPYEIMASTNGEEALVIAKKELPDLILLDVNMPGIDGYEVCRRLKSDTYTKNIQIIFLTAQNSSEDESKGLELGAVDYITKPFSVRIVKQRVHNHLKLKRIENELSKSNEHLQEKINLALEIQKKQQRLAGMGEMISMIAHQWRQPLSTLGLILQKQALFSERGLLTPDTIEDNTSKAMSLVNQMSTTINDFRDFFKTSKAIDKIEMNDIYKRVSTLLPLSREYGIDIENKCEATGTLETYTNELIQAIINICINSFDALKDREQEKKIIILSDEVKNETYTLSIQDNAGGIPDEIIEEIFTPYFSTKGNNGTGLGLYMCKTIIEDHLKGTIHVSNDKNGAIFKISLPLILQAD